MDFSHYAPLWGEALLTVLAVLIVLLGSLMKNSGKLMGYLSAAGLSSSPGTGVQQSHDCKACPVLL